MTDIVERLNLAIQKGLAIYGRGSQQVTGHTDDAKLLIAARDEIERLRKDWDRLFAVKIELDREIERLRTELAVARKSCDELSEYLSDQAAEIERLKQTSGERVP